MASFKTNSNGAQAGTPTLPIAPAFIRIPRAGTRDPYTGLTRTALFALVKDGKVKSISLRQPGCKRGVRLIDARSLVETISQAA
ncbi:MAG TPA: hypothetical protein P5205_08270 [Candidatus Paceibacterota bacterium]|nr:hypothetical protein [Verrucomicrobiota bacterium]HSA10354.1 hypothetical protein [Candidatus Paceibacterota bacterium]